MKKYNNYKIKFKHKNNLQSHISIIIKAKYLIFNNNNNNYFVIKININNKY